MLQVWLTFWLANNCPNGCGQFRLLIQAKSCADQGLKADAIGRLVDMAPFVVRKLFKQCQHFSFGELQQIYQRLLEIDHAVKTGRAELPISLTILISEIAY